MLRRFLLMSGVVAVLASFPVTVNAQTRVEDESWRASAAQMEARLQALLDDIRRRMDDLAASPVSGAQPGVGEIEEMIAMQRRLRILELRQREAQILAEMTAALQRARNELVNRDEPRVAATSTPAVVQPQGQPDSRDVDFRILSVSGSGDALRAAVWSQRTGRINVGVGTRLPDGTVVSRVEVDGVWVRRPGMDVDVPLGQADGGQTPSSGTVPPVVTIGPPPVPPPPGPLSLPSPLPGPGLQGPFTGGGTQQAPRPSGGFGLGVPPEPSMAAPPSMMMPGGSVGLPSPSPAGGR